MDEPNPSPPDAAAPISQSTSEFTALWVPGWYELDQPLALGVRQKYWFFTNPPEEYSSTMNGIELCFYNNLASASNMQLRYATIEEIHHPVLGPLTRIDTDGLDYIFAPVAGDEVIVDAEENIGKAHSSDAQVQEVEDWSVHVKLIEVSDPLNDLG